MHLKEILFLPEGVRKRQNDTELAGELDEDNEEHLWHGLSAQKIDWHLPQPPNSYDLKDEEEIFSEILSSQSLKFYA